MLATIRELAVIAAIALAAAACHGESKAPPASAELPDLGASLDAVRSEFNAHASEPRFVTLLSAT